jgi:organic hydroperoxide reductase OsmC/OhrA
MSEHTARIAWKHSRGDFLKGKYSREHTWSFDGGLTIPASPALSSVPVPWSNPAHIDPEEAFVASIASCHMLTFLYVAYRAGIEVTAYEDSATGVMTRGENGVPWVSSVQLRPRISYAGARPPADVEQHLHHEAHEQCFISNSVKTQITVVPSE